MADADGPRGLLAAVVRASIRHRGVVLALAAVLAAYGAYDLASATYDVFPEFAPPQVVVDTEAPGFGPEEVEAIATRPVEDALAGATGLATLRSTSLQGLSVVTAVFRWGTDPYRDREVVAERLGSVAGRLPAGVSLPRMLPLTSSAGTLLIGALTSSTRSLMDVRAAADWTLRPRLLAVPGVADVAVYGRDVRQLQVQVRPGRLVRFGLALDDVTRAAARATGVRGGGFVDTPNQRIVIRAEGQALEPDEIARTVVATRGGASVTLGDVARVGFAPAPPVGAGTVMGAPSVNFVVLEQYGASTLDATRRVDAALDELRPALAREGIALRADLFRPARFIRTAVGNVREALLLGGVLVLVVLLLFLLDLRTAAISAVAIPLSLLAATLALRRLGLGLDTMTLGGLAIAVGEVVDDAVIDVENALRRLRENRARPDPRPAAAVVLDASLEVRGAVVHATLAVILVFLPVLTLGGVAGRLFAPLGAAYVLAVLSSLAVALTVTPALVVTLLGRRELAAREPPVVRWARGRYAPLLASVERRPRAVLAVVALLVAGAVAAVPFLGGTFIPRLREGHYIVHLTAAPGTSLDESLRIGGRVTRALLAVPGVAHVSQDAGRTPGAEDVHGTHQSELDVGLAPGGPAPGPDDLRRALAPFPGVAFEVRTFLAERMEETLSGFTAPVVVKVFGDDLDALDQAAAQVARALAATPGAAEVRVQAASGVPELLVQPRQADLERWGMTRVQVLDAVATAFQGRTVAQLEEGSRVTDLAVILDPRDRESPAQVRSLPLRAPGGAWVTLGRLADVSDGTGRYEVLHEGARRLQSVTCDVTGRDVASFVRDARARAARLSLPQGTYLEFSGSAEEQGRATRDLLVRSGMAAIGIALLLSLATRGVRNLALLLANVPFALVGGMVAVLAMGGRLSLGSTVGFVTLFGIALRNGLVLLSHYEHLVEVEGLPWGREAATRGASDRLAPILMTSLVTALGLLPLAVGMHAPGREIEGPMAVVILGGLATSTALSLLVLPSLALRFGRFGPERPGQ